MPTRFATGFDPQAVGATMAAFDKAYGVLGLVNKADAMTESVAKLVVEIARAGERDPDKPCALTLQAVGDPTIASSP